MAKNYYDILGIDKNASEADIKSAFRKLSKKYHPDVCKEDNASEKFTEINEAYQVLSDKQQRAKYDTFGTVNDSEIRQKQYEQGGFGGFDGFDGFGGFGGGFSGFNSHRQTEYGSDIKITITCTLDEIYNGVHKKIRVKKGCTCHHCSGSGSEDHETITCPKCGGTGFTRTVKKTPFGVIQMQSDCPDCHGTGKKIAHPCNVCDGTGVEQRYEEVEFDIPAGMPSDSYFVVNGSGNAGPHRGIAGNLLVIVSELPNDKGLKRDENNNLLYTLKVKYSDLVLGVDAEIPWIKGYQKLHIDSGTQSGKVYTLYGKGMPNPNNINQKANYYVTVECDIPTSKTLHPDDKELIKELRKNGRC
jgi:molecular chaperone DnaJ